MHRAGDPGAHPREPGKCRPGVVRRVAAALGLRAPSGKPAIVVPSPALSQITGRPGPIAGRVVGVVAGPGSDLAGITRLRKALVQEGATLRLIAETGGKLVNGDLTETVDRTLLTTRSIEYDAVVVAAGSTGLNDRKLAVLALRDEPSLQDPRKLGR